MAEYIEREAAYRFAQDQLKKETGAYSRGWNHAMNVMKSALHNNDAIHAAEVVPVVRCKDCRYAYDSVGGWCCSHGICVDCVVREDFFCADGARMDGDGA